MAASWRGVTPSRVRAVARAPALINRSARSRLSRSAAQWSAVVPSTCGTLTSALRAMAARTASRSPRIAASATSAAAARTVTAARRRKLRENSVVRLMRLLSVTVVGAFGAAQPLDQALQFFVLQLCAALSHVQCYHTPAVWTEARGADPLDRVARGACSLQQGLGFTVCEERRHFARNVRARKRLRRRAEAHFQPIEKNASLLLWQRHHQAAMLCRDE